MFLVLLILLFLRFLIASPVAIVVAAFSFVVVAVVCNLYLPWISPTSKSKTKNKHHTDPASSTASSTAASASSAPKPSA
jgi:hypothetical protein